MRIALRNPREQLPNPVAAGAVHHTCSLGGLQTGAQASGKELSDDLALGIEGGGGAGASTAGILHGQMERGRPRLVPRRRVRAGSKQTSHCP